LDTVQYVQIADDISKNVADTENIKLPLEKIELVSPCTPVLTVLKKFQSGNVGISAVVSDSQELLAFFLYLTFSESVWNLTCTLLSIKRK